MNLSEITKAIKSIDNFDDLKVVNTALSQQWSSLQKDIQGQFAVGDKVTLTHRGRVVEGIVTKLLVKNITVETDIGIFRCSPSLLTKVSDELTTV
tara:strand:- start:155 stop:439 length:285 start_codon:yes stop_codon:yes gene_type:complete